MRLAGLALLLLVCHLPSLLRAATADNDYVSILSTIHEADDLLGRGRTAEAMTKYRDARNRLHKLQGAHPGWNPRLMAYRLQYIADQMAGASRAADLQLPAFELLQAGWPLIIAHRGLSALAPENTLTAFRMAVQAGSDLVELDYHHSRDGVPVVIHDATLDRTTDVNVRLAEKGVRVNTRTSEELATLDAGQWFHPSFAGEKVPTLSQALSLIQSNSVTLIERKAGDAATCAALLAQHGWINRVIVQSFDWDYLRDFHRVAPAQVLGALGPPSTRGGKPVPPEEKRLNERWLDEIAALGARLVVWNREVSADAVLAAHARGLKVWIYTINDAVLLHRLLDMGVDGIITDNPPLIWKALAIRDDAVSRVRGQ